MEIIDPKKLLVKIAPILDNLGIKYFITGGFAVAIWGRPRATYDIDIVIKIFESQVNQLAAALRKISEAGYISEDAAREAIRQKGEFNFIDPKSGVKVDFWVAKDRDFSLLEFERRKIKKISGKRIYFISPEDLILSKLRWRKQSGSALQLEDIESIIKISGKKLDMKYLERGAKKQGDGGIFRKLIEINRN